jgi:hypothetical protein
MYAFNEKYNCVQFDNKHILTAVIVFTADSFNGEYSEKERSYEVTNGNKWFLGNQGGTSLFGDCLDGSEQGIRLDWYIRRDEHPWKVERCYIVSEEHK